MVRFNKLVLRLKLPNSSSVYEHNQIEPGKKKKKKRNFRQAIFWGLDIGLRNDQLLKAA